MSAAAAHATAAPASSATDVTAPTCGACLMPMLRADGTPNLNPPHCCVACHKDVHSHCFCDDVWMPLEDKYFCSVQCIKAHNAQLAREHAHAVAATENDDERRALCASGPMRFPLANRPGEEAEAETEPEKKPDEAEESLDDEPAESVDEEEDKNEDVGSVQSISEANEKCVSDPTVPLPQESSPVGNSNVDEPNPLDALLVEGARVMHKFKLRPEDSSSGVWCGGIVGGHSPDGKHLCIAYDDAEILYMSREEVEDLFHQAKFKEFPPKEKELGLVADVPQNVYAAAFSQIKLNNKYLPVGALLRDEDESLCGQPLYSAHILSLEMADKLLEGATVLVRRGRSRFAATLCSLVPRSM